jgi:hypothetical protein
MGRVLAGVMPFDLFDAEGNLILTTNTLTDEGINSTVDKDEIRGGSANQLLGNYFYGSNLELNCVDALFSLEYLALKMGANIEMGSDVQLSESITITEANKITPSKTPVAFPSTQLIVGSYKLPTESSDDWKTIRFENGSATVAGLKVGDITSKEALINLFGEPDDIYEYRIDEDDDQEWAKYQNDTYTWCLDADWTTSNFFEIVMNINTGIVEEIRLDHSYFD